MKKYGLKETAEIISFVRNIQYDDLPGEVVVKAKQCLTDTIGCAFVGLKTTNHARIVTEMVKELGGKPEATIWGEGFKTSTINAAMANGTSCHGLDLDDAHRVAFLHVGVGTIPAIIAEAERSNASGRDVITATVAAFEVAIRIALAVNPALRLRGFHTTGTVGTFGAAMGVGKIIGLNEEQLINALGLAGTQAAGLWQFNDDGDMSKRFHPGKAASNGILASRLAQKGMTGPFRVLEGRFGFPATFAGEYQPDVIREGLGERYHIMGVGFKIHAACRFTNTPIDAALILTHRYGIKPEDVAHGKIRSCKIAADQLKKKDIQTLLDAQISGPFCVALAIAHKKAGHQEFLRGIKEEVVLELTKKIDMVEEPRFGLMERTAIVEITTKDGMTYSQQVDLAKGEPEVPLTKDEMDSKYIELAARILDSDKIEDSLQMLNELENVNDVSELIKCLIP